MGFARRMRRAGNCARPQVRKYAYDIESAALKDFPVALVELMGHRYVTFMYRAGWRLRLLVPEGLELWPTCSLEEKGIEQLGLMNAHMLQFEVFDPNRYEKEIYWRLNIPERTVTKVYPNAGILNAIDGSGREWKVGLIAKANQYSGGFGDDDDH